MKKKKNVYLVIQKSLSFLENFQVLISYLIYFQYNNLYNMITLIWSSTHDFTFPLAGGFRKTQNRGIYYIESIGQVGKS